MVPTSYNEAPAQGLFSVLERVLNGRESLSLDCAEALTRISLEGPGVATMEGFTCQRKQFSCGKATGRGLQQQNGFQE